jgi:hypothetical protein
MVPRAQLGRIALAALLLAGCGAPEPGPRRDAAADALITPAPTRDAPIAPARDGAAPEPADTDAAPALDGGRPDRPPWREEVGTCGLCEAYGEPELTGRVGNGRLDELSGLAASRRHPGVFWAHNDHDGDRATEIFALTATGEVLARFPAPQPPPHDAEDVAIGPCPGGSCLFLADVGNNKRDRTEFALYRAPEPELDPDAPPAAPLAFERFAVRYDDGAHDVEALLVDPASGRIFLVTKRAADLPSAVYGLPAALDPAQPNVAKKVATLPVPTAGDSQTTGASAHPCGGGFLLRTYRTLYEFRTPLGAPLEQAFAVAPRKVPAPPTPGFFYEAVGWLPDGRGYLTAPEGERAELHRVRCRVAP